MSDQTPELRATLSAKAVNDLPDSAFAYIESGGTKDDEGKTTPRRLRHYPVQDKAHADDALTRANAAIAGDDEGAKGIAEKALPKIKAAVKKFGDEQEKKAANWDAQHRSGPSYGDLQDMLSSAVAAEFCKDDDDYAWVCDFGDDWAVYSQNGEKFQVSYQINGDTVTLGDPEPVRTQTTYVPLEAEQKSGNNWATPKMATRAFSSLVEWPSACEQDIQVRFDASSEDTSVAQFVGYASTTGVPYSVRDWLGEYTETILPGAFAKTLREQGNVPLLFNHDGIPLASTGSGTSRLSEDAKGLRNEADLDRRDALTNSICVQLQRGVLNKMSFSFRGVKDDWNDAYDDRSVAECALYDSSIVTYPANDDTSGELVEAMRSAMGREGRSLWLAETELSVRSALPAYLSGEPFSGQLQDLSDDMIERALRALAHADEVVCRSRVSQHGRARTFLVARALGELRAGKVLSAKNQGLLQNALDALSAADKAHAKVTASHQTAVGALNDVLGANDSPAAVQDGKDNGTPPGNGNPIMPQDGAGPRSLPPAVVQARRQVEQLKRAR